MLFALVTRSRMQGQRFSKKSSIDSTTLRGLVQDRHNGSSNNAVALWSDSGKSWRGTKMLWKAGWKKMERYCQFCWWGTRHLDSPTGGGFTTMWMCFLARGSKKTHPPAIQILHQQACWGSLWDFRWQGRKHFCHQCVVFQSLMVSLRLLVFGIWSWRCGWDHCREPDNWAQVCWTWWLLPGSSGSAQKPRTLPRYTAKCLWLYLVTWWMFGYGFMKAWGLRTSGRQALSVHICSLTLSQATVYVTLDVSW